VSSDGGPLENPAKTGAQADRHAPYQENRQCNMPMGHIPLALVFFYVRPRLLRLHPPLQKGPQAMCYGVGVM